MSATIHSGHIKFECDTLVYTQLEREKWRVPIADIRVIGEFTNNEGPYGDDYFLVFITPDQQFEASFYAEGRDALLDALGHKLDYNLQTGLCNSTSLASRVLWPAHFAGHPLFDNVPEECAGNIFGRLRQRVLPRVQMQFTEEVRREFESRR
ncbi:MAG: hypothetical protein H7Y43_08905 [Akkermansiaceae bacterium]|nr:hypothetical protein [Verrucomicrobiales bacterium]